MGTAWKSHVMRCLVERAVFLTLAGLAVRTWCVEGLLAPYRVASGSMAPTLLGPHFDLVCPDCGCPQACDASTPPRGGRAVCPNCGYREAWPEPESALAGDRLLVDKATFRLRPPQRWEVVAVREPDHAERVAIKRVVGLPGESVQFCDGDLYINGRIQRKPFAQQRATAVLVYDASHPPRPSPGLPPRWSGDGPANRWQESGGRFFHPAGVAAGANKAAATDSRLAVSPGHAGPIDWLRYRHWRRVPGGGKGGQVQMAPITNEFFYNAAMERPHREVRPVRNLLLAFRLVRTCGQGRLSVAIADGRKEFQVQIDPSRASYVISEDGRLLTAARGSPLPLAVDGREIEVWLAGARLVFLVGGRPVFVRCYEPAITGCLPGVAQSAPRTPHASREGVRHAERDEYNYNSLAIGVSDLGIEISDLRVYRDIDYSRPARVNPRWGYGKPVNLGKNEYFVVGDNSEVSIDSRSWSDGPGIPASLLVGRSLLVHFPCRGIMIGGRHFQVPDILRIRYIR
jgi:signal peptidase I